MGGGGELGEEQGALAEVQLREGIRPESKAIPGPTLLSLCCPYLLSSADRRLSSTLSCGVTHMGFQEEVCPEPICLQPLAWLQAKEGTHSAAPMRLLRLEGQG